MSRVGKKPILIPKDVQVELTGYVLKATGPQGTLSLNVHPAVEVRIEDGEIRVHRATDSRQHRSLHGLTRTLIDNIIIGVASGFQKRLEVVGAGYRAELKGKSLNLQLGYSHPILFSPPESIRISLEGNTKIIVFGPDKQLVGQVAAKIRSFRPPEPYKGKGIRYEGEFIKRKAGKAAVTVGG